MEKELSDFQDFFNSKKFTVANKALEKLLKKFKFFIKTWNVILDL